VNKVANPEQQPGAGQDPIKSQDAAGLSARGAARRRFTGAGIKVSGVILTLASQPGMAATGQVCTTPSGFTSAHWDSHSPGSAFLGRSPGYWKNHPEAWGRNLAANAAFGSVFSCSNDLKTCSMMTVVAHLDPAKDIDKYNVGSHIVATLLNVRSGKVKVLTEERVLTIWNEYNSKGYFTPQAGAQPWYGGDITRYLKSTMDCGLDNDACIV
jgi:hypothetical protein